MTAINADVRFRELVNLNEVGVLQLLLDDAVVNLIVRETNRYANVQHNDHSFQTNSEEVWTFISILILSGYNNLPQQQHYWSTSADIGVELVGRAMTRERFKKIKQYLHFNNNAAIDTTDRTFKVEL